MSSFLTVDRVDQLLLRHLQPGDHIAAARKKGIYHHHGIYEGTHNGFPSVIHFQGPVTSLVKGVSSSSSSSSSMPLICTYKCGYNHPKKGGRVISCIDCFSQGQQIIKLQYMTNKGFVSRESRNWESLKHGKVIPGYSCTKNKYYLEHFLDGKLYGHSLVPEKKLHNYTMDHETRFYTMISERASDEVLDKAFNSKFEPYSVVDSNCEHFAVFCKTGVLASVQVQNGFHNIKMFRKMSLENIRGKAYIDPQQAGGPPAYVRTGTAEPGTKGAACICVTP